MQNIVRKIALASSIATTSCTFNESTLEMKKGFLTNKNNKPIYNNNNNNNSDIEKLIASCMQPENLAVLSENSDQELKKEFVNNISHSEYKQVEIELSRISKSFENLKILFMDDIGSLESLNWLNSPSLTGLGIGRFKGNTSTIFRKIYLPNIRTLHFYINEDSNSIDLEEISKMFLKKNSNKENINMRIGIISHDIEHNTMFSEIKNNRTDIIATQHAEKYFNAKQQVVLDTQIICPSRLIKQLLVINKKGYDYFKIFIAS